MPKKNPRTTQPLPDYDAPAPTGPLSGLIQPEPLSLPQSEEESESVALAPTKFRTCLKLTEEQQRKLMDYVEKRLPEIQREMGLDVNFAISDTSSFMGIRKRNADSYDGDYGWRVLIGSIFEKSNFTLGTNMRHTRYIGARVQDDLLGTNPFFAAIARKPDKAELARQAEEYVQDRIDRSPVRDGLREAQKTALIVNEAVVKSSWVKDATKFKGPADVFVGEDGQPLRTPAKGLLIFENDNFQPAPMVEPAQDGSPQVVMLEKDPSFTMQPQQYATAHFDDLEQEIVHYDGPKSEPLDYRCFLCPLTVASIHDADLNAHVYREGRMRLKQRFEQMDEVSRRYFASGPPTGDKQPRLAQGEQEQPLSEVYEEVNVGEVFVRFDADEDGQAEEIWLVKDLDEAGVESAIFYDYTANHFKKRPFEVIPGLERVRGRWYGQGIYSLNYDQELHIDAEFNRAQVRGSRSSSVTFFSRGAVTDWDNGIQPVIGGDYIWELNAGYDRDRNPPIFKVNLAEENEQAIELMEISRQAADAKVGAISAKDASASDLNQSKTATGIVNLQAASDVITKATEQEQAKGINAVLDQVVTLTLDHMDPAVLMLDKSTSALVTLNKDEIRSLDRDVRLTLTRSRSTQMQQANQSAAQIVGLYWQAFRQDPEQAKAVRPFYIGQLKGLEVNDADEALPEVTDEMIQAFQQRQAPQEPPKKSISTKYSELARSEQEQVLQAEGIQPAAPEEIAQQKAEETAAKAAEMAAKRPNNETPAKSVKPEGSAAAA